MSTVRWGVTPCIARIITFNTMEVLFSTVAINAGVKPDHINVSKWTFSFNLNKSDIHLV